MHKSNKEITLIALVITIFGIVIFLMRPIFSPIKEESLAIFINNQPQNKLPTSKNYEVNVNCQTSEGYWDYNNWTLRVKNLNNTKEKCNLSFLEKYNISYELNGGRWIKESDNTYIFGKEYTSPTNVFSLNKTFLGWYDNPSFTGNAVTKISLGTTGNKKYYAKYIINYQSINFLSLIGTGSWDGVKHSNGTWTFQYFQEGNELNASKFQIYDPKTAIWTNFIFVEGYEKGYYTIEFTQTETSGNYYLYFGINGTTMDPKLGFQYQLEQGKKYRFSYEVVSANAKEFIWKNVNFEKNI